MRTKPTSMTAPPDPLGARFSSTTDDTSVSVVGPAALNACAAPTAATAAPPAPAWKVHRAEVQLSNHIDTMQYLLFHGITV
jgi:hypothetical protein